MPTTVAAVSIPEDEVRRARRIEVGVYVFTAVALVVLGIFLTSKKSSTGSWGRRSWSRW